MHRDGIMNSAADTGGLQSRPQRIPLGQPDHILMKYVCRLRPAHRKRQRQPGETRVITVRDDLPACIVSLQRPELDAEYGGLDRVETRIYAGAGADITLAPAVLPNFPQRCRERGIVRNDHAAVAKCSEVFCRIKAEASNITERSHRSAAIECAMALGAIFYEPQAMYPGDLGEGRQLGRLALNVRRQNRLRTAGQRGVRCTL